jgi:putative oxidoreductase
MVVVLSQEINEMKDISSKLRSGARVLMGVGFLVPGLNGFLHFMTLPPMPAAAADFMGALAATGYLLPLIKGVEVAGGALLLSGRFVPLALTVLAPILVNIVAFHLALAPEGLGMPLVLFALELYLAWSYRAAFRPMLRARAPGARSEEAPGGDLAIA